MSSCRGPISASRNDSWARLEPGLGLLERGPGVVVLLARHRPFLHQGRPAFERQSRVVPGGLPLGDRGLGLGDLLGTRAMLEPLEDRFQIVAPGTGQPQLVVEVALVEGREHLTGLHRIALVDGERLDPPLHLEREVDLANIDVALEDQPAVVLRRRCSK